MRFDDEHRSSLQQLSAHEHGTKHRHEAPPRGTHQPDYNSLTP
jgi:hypothetical protein